MWWPARSSPLESQSCTGRSTDPDGTPIPGVRVDIVGRPELGWTLTQGNGGYQLAVNGGRMDDRPTPTRRLSRGATQGEGAMERLPVGPRIS